MKIVMLEPIAVSAELLNELSKPLVEKGHEIEICLSPLTDGEKEQKAKYADILIVANSPLPSRIIENSPNLKMISVAFTGIDHIPMDVCRSKNILVSNAQGYATVAVTELVFGLLFSVMRNLIKCDYATRNALTKDGLVGNELFGKTFGIVGCGAIGRSVAAVARAFGCNVLAYESGPNKTDTNVTYCEIGTLLAQSDVISLHVPLTPETKHMINKEKLDLMKPSAILINTARGPVVDGEALANALNTGKIAGAGIDVFDTEPPIAQNNPLITAKNTVLAPHIGFASKESMIKRAKIVFDNVSAWLDGKPINIKE